MLELSSSFGVDFQLVFSVPEAGLPPPARTVQLFEELVSFPDTEPESMVTSGPPLLGVATQPQLVSPGTGPVSVRIGFVSPAPGDGHSACAVATVPAGRRGRGGQR